MPLSTVFRKRQPGRLRWAGLIFVFLWFFIGGVAHFVSPQPFLSIVPPGLPLRLEAVYVSGFFELAGACGLLWVQTRRVAGCGLFFLTIAVTPANLYMLQHAGQFPSVPVWMLEWRLVLQILLLAVIVWSTNAHTLITRKRERV